MDTEELEVVEEARLPLPTIVTPYHCNACGEPLDNLSAYHNTCQSCGYSLMSTEKKAITTFIANIPWRELCG